MPYLSKNVQFLVWQINRVECAPHVKVCLLLLGVSHSNSGIRSHTRRDTYGSTLETVRT